MTDAPRPNRGKLIVLLVIFFVPLAIAFAMYYGSSWRPAGTTNHGQLLLPLQTVPAEVPALRGKWALVVIADGQCDENCRTALILARQTRLALNQDSPRVSRVLLATAHCCDRAYLDATHPGLQTLDLAADGQAALAPALLAAFPATGLQDGLFIVDPLGNVVMRFDIHDTPKDLLTDLKKLLKLSSIG
jgi:hypothetical protein